jgi:two-component system cell cycle response regulator
MTRPGSREPRALIVTSELPAELAVRLTSAGFCVDLAHSLAEAFGLARDESFDLLAVYGSRTELPDRLRTLSAEPATRAIPLVALLDGAPSTDELELLFQAGAMEAVHLDAAPPAFEARLHSLAAYRRIYLEARELSLRDELTGLYNRRFFDERLEQEVARADRHGLTLGCLIADIDHFKQVNDGLGHLVGDDALKAVATVFSRRTRRSDVAARIGGDEFAVLLSANTLPGIRKYAEIIRQAIAGVRVGPRQERALTVSIGFAIYPSSLVKNPRVDLVKAADDALLAAKRLGRDRILMAEELEFPSPCGSLAGSEEPHL